MKLSAMPAIDPLDEQKSVKLRQRLWGAAVLIALMVIFLPLLLDGSGSESQYRRVESLRAEPPRVLNEAGQPESANPELVISPTDEANRASVEEIVTATPAVQPVIAETVEPVVEPVEPAVVVNPQPEAVTQAPTVRSSSNQRAQPLSAWVVQAGSFAEEENALAVRDKLRRAGYPSFVTPSDSETLLFRVRVGPMISLEQAESNRDKVMRLLQREAIVVSYP